MNLIQRLASGRRTETRYTLDDYANWFAQALGAGSFSYDGHQYPLNGVTLTDPTSKATSIPENFAGYVTAGLRGNGIVSTLETIRLQVFSQARFQWRNNDRLGGLFGTAELAPLENEHGGPNGRLLGGVLFDADMAGNYYGTRVGNEIVRLRPDWVDTIVEQVATAVGPVGHRVHAYVYWPDGHRHGGAVPTILMPWEVAHFAPLPDPLAPWRGMSWLTPVVREIQGDKAYTDHKLSFIANSATPNLAVTLKESVGLNEYREFVEAMNENHVGPGNAGKTLYLGGGADITVVGADMAQLDFKAVQGATETRLAAAAGVGAVIAQFSEGMQGSSLNAGNYAASRRRFADITARHLWQEAAGAFSSILTPPRGAHLWYDESSVSFLQEDRKDDADITAARAAAYRQLVDGGVDPDVAARVVDLPALVGGHTGNLSVQLQPVGALPEPGGSGDDPEPDPAD